MTLSLTGGQLSISDTLVIKFVKLMNKKRLSFMEQDKHYVYQYRDNNQKGIVRYVGRGKDASRAVKHQSVSHNKPLENWIANGKYKLEISGPFGNKDTAIAVESALISSLKPLYNSREECTKYAFRPLGVPDKYVTRLEKTPLEFDELFKNKTERILLVKVTDKPFENRIGYDMVNPPADSDIVERVKQYWQLGNEQYLNSWIKNKNESPTLLLGVTGSPGNQIIIASLAIDINAWDKVTVAPYKLITVPLKDPTKLDKFCLRGYRINKSAGIKFSRNRQDFFNLIEKDMKSKVRV